MDPAYFVIAILGCADGAADCRRVATVPTHFASEAACSAAAPDALARNSDLDFPTLVAECRAAHRPAAVHGTAPAAPNKPMQVPAEARRG